MLTYNVQLANFSPDQVEDRGFVNQAEAMKALTQFPFKAELSKLKNSEDGCLPTITFKDADDNTHLAIWIDETGKFTIDGKLKKHRFGREQFTKDPDDLPEILTHFMDNDLDGVNGLLGQHASFWDRFPPLGFWIFFEAPAVLFALYTIDLKIAVANLIFHRPSIELRFIFQMVLANILFALLLKFFAKQDTQ